MGLDKANALMNVPWTNHKRKHRVKETEETIIFLKCVGIKSRRNDVELLAAAASVEVV